MRVWARQEANVAIFEEILGIYPVQLQQPTGNPPRAVEKVQGPIWKGLWVRRRPGL